MDVVSKETWREGHSWNALEKVLASLPFIRESKATLAATEGGQVDGVVRFRTPDRRTQTMSLEFKSLPLRRGDAQRIAASIERRLKHEPSTTLLVFAPYVDPSAARVLIDAGISYADAHGNLHVAIGTQYLARVEKPGVPAKPAAAKGWRPASYRVLLAMLAFAENVQATTRALAQEAGGVSPQTVTELRAKLHDRGLLLQTRNEWRWAPGGYQRALDLWTHGFANTLAPSLEVGRFRARERDPHELETRLAPKFTQLGAWAWGGGAACERLTNFYRGARRSSTWRHPLQRGHAILDWFKILGGPSR